MGENSCGLDHQLQYPQVSWSSVRRLWDSLFNIHVAVVCIKTDIIRDKSNSVGSGIRCSIFMLQSSASRPISIEINPIPSQVSQATMLSESCSRQVWRIASETWSQSLSGWPSLTDL